MVACKNCGEEIDLVTALSSAPFSWPEMQTIWYLCVQCGIGNHIRFLEHAVQRIEITGAPGPHWEIIENEQRIGIGVQPNANDLTIRLDEREFIIRRVNIWELSAV